MILTALEPEDLELLYTIENDPAMWAVSNINVPYSRFVLSNYLATQQNDIYADKQVRLVVRVGGKDAQRAIGLADLFNFSPEHMRAEMGIAILRSEQGKGYGKETVRALLRYARETLHLHVVYAVVPVDNLPSIAALRACGMEQTGRFKDWIRTADGWKDAVQLQCVMD